MNNFILSLDQLKELCKKYDKENGNYPESEYEGYSMYEYICEELGLEQPENWNLEPQNTGD